MFRRFVGALLAALFTLLLGAQLAAAAPLLYVYEGNAAVSGVTKFANMLGRKPDGVIDFIAFDSWGSFDGDCGYTAGGWRGQGYKLSVRIPLTVTGTSLADVAAGKYDSHFTACGQNLIANGFPTADVSIGWEGNGGWYPWAASGYGNTPATYKAAFQHVSALLKGLAGAQFKIWFNPSFGWQQTQVSDMTPDPSSFYGIAWDGYINTWYGNCPATEPGVWQCNLSGSWGWDSMGKNPSGHGYYAQLPTAMPEYGVGSRTDGYGACSAAQVGSTPPWNLCDDGYAEAQGLAFNAAVGAEHEGIWDYNAGDYNSQMSNGARPNEALALMQAMGGKDAAGEDVQAKLKGAVVYTAADHPLPALASPKVGFRVQLANGDIASVVWGSGTAADPVAIADLTVAATPAPTPTPTPAPAPAKVSPPTATGVAQAVFLTPTLPLAANADGSASGPLTIPAAGKATTWTINLSSPRKLGWADSKGALSGALWNGGADFSAFTWNDATGKGATASIYVGPN